jgi:hypothetical protein
MSEQPVEAEPLDEPEDMFFAMVAGRPRSMGIRFRHGCLDVREQIEIFVIFIDAAFPIA